MALEHHPSQSSIARSAHLAESIDCCGPHVVVCTFWSAHQRQLPLMLSLHVITPNVWFWVDSGTSYLMVALRPPSAQQCDMLSVAARYRANEAMHSTQNQCCAPCDSSQVGFKSPQCFFYDMCCQQLDILFEQSFWTRLPQELQLCIDTQLITARFVCKNHH